MMLFTWLDVLHPNRANNLSAEAHQSVYIPTEICRSLYIYT